MYDFDMRRAITGYRVAYHPHETNRCPGCAFCATALPLHAGASMGPGIGQGVRRGGARWRRSPLAA